MVARYGMSSKIGPVAFHDDGVHATAGGMIVEGKEYSEKIAATIDEEVKSFVEKALEEATEVLKKHRPALDAIVAHLLEKETLEQEEFEAILLSHGIVAKGVDKKV
jgi:cell division protease FtsH